MAMTDKKRRFAAALRSGASNKDAAIAAGYSAKTAAQAGSRLAKDPDVLAELGRKETVVQAKQQAETEGKPLDLQTIQKIYSDPKDFLKALMNDLEEDPKLRLEAAKTLMPFVHGKVGDQGKKGAKADAAKKAGAGRFAPPPPPLRMIPGGK